MRTRLMLEALAAWLALAAVSGQACASIQTGGNSVLTMVTNPEASLDETGTQYSDGKVPANGGIRANANVALLTSGAVARKGTRTRLATSVPAPAGAGQLTPGGKNGGTELKRAVFNQHDVLGASPPQGLLVAANGSSDQIKAIQAVRDGDLDAERFYLVANAKPAPEPTVPVPEPGNWATALAGLLGVIAIARRRMSL